MTATPQSPSGGETGGRAAGDAGNEDAGAAGGGGAVGDARPAGGREEVRPPEAQEGHREEDLETAFDRIVVEGRPRLRRPWPDLLATGTVGGMEVAFGVLALLFVTNATGSQALGGVAFTIGFIGLRLGHSELFTEGFLVPVAVVAAGEARLRDLLRLWAGTLAGNLAGGWLMAWIIIQAFPSLDKEAVTAGRYYVDAGINLRSFCLGVLAGGAITLMTRMHNGTDSDGAKLVASVAIGFLLAGVRLFHSVLDSIISFTALNTGHAPFSYGDWARWFGWAVFANLVGGLGLTTLLRLVRSRHRLIDHRVAAGRPTPGPVIAASRRRHDG